MKSFSYKASMAAFTFIVAGNAMAASIVGGPGVASPTNTVTFSEVVLPSGTALTNQYGSLGINFTGLYYDPCPSCVTTLPTGAKPDAGNFITFDGGSPSVSFNFAGAATAFSFSFASDGAIYTLGAYLSNSVVESFSFAGSNWQTYGFTGSLFDEVRLTYAVTPFVSEFLVDDLKWTATTAPIPEPEVYAMLLAGLGLLGAAKRRRAICAA